MADILKDAVASAFSAVSAAMPSQAPLFRVDGSRTDERGDARPISGTVAALVASVSGGSSLADFSSGSTADAKSLLVKCRPAPGGWFDETDPQPGDVFEAVNGDRFAVASAANVRGLFHRIEVRRC